MYIALLGAPGSGKGTQCKRLAERLNIPHLSTGEMLRDAKRRNDARARQIAECIDAGQLVSDDLIMQIVDERLGLPDCERGCLLDGVPRTLAQAHRIEALLRRRGWSLDHAIALEVPRAELVRRLLARAKLDGRTDDTPETIERRMEVYERETAPVLNYFRDQKRLTTIAATGTPDEVFEKVLKALGKTAKKLEV